jgi:hypothetical protein
MSMIKNLGEGYYGVEPTSGRVAQAVLDLVEEAYEEAMAIPDEDIIITENGHPISPEAASHTSS